MNSVIIVAVPLFLTMFPLINVLSTSYVQYLSTYSQLAVRSQIHIPQLICSLYHCYNEYMLMFQNVISSHTSSEYKAAMEIISPIVEKHKSELKPGDPQLNYCDKAVEV